MNILACDQDAMGGVVMYYTKKKREKRELVSDIIFYHMYECYAASRYFILNCRIILLFATYRCTKSGQNFLPDFGAFASILY